MKKLLLSALGLLVVGMTFLALENTFYQYIDESGVLQESLFMPLGMFSLLAAVLLILVFVAGKLLACGARMLEKQRD